MSFLFSDPLIPLGKVNELVVVDYPKQRVLM